MASEKQRDYLEMNIKLRNLRRRDFLKLAAVGGVALAVPTLGASISRVDSHRAQSENNAYESSMKLMGTYVAIRIEDENMIDSGAAELAASAAFKEVERLAMLFTRFQGGTQIFSLNENGHLESPSTDVANVLNAAALNSARTEGSYDITVKPVLDLLEDYLYQGDAFPSDAQFDSARSLIDYEKVSVTRSYVSLEKPSMGVTLDCIGKGYIIDRAVTLLKSRGVRSGFVNGGGTLALIGSRYGGEPWSIGIVDPLNPVSTIGTLKLKDQAVSTSGDYENYFTPDKKYYHIINPSTALSPSYSHSATVVAPTVTEADPLGLSLMVEESGQGLKTFETMPDSQRSECLIYTRSKQIVMSSGMSKLLSP